MNSKIICTACDTEFELSPPKPNFLGYTRGPKRADGYFPKYVCPACGKTFLQPMERPLRVMNWVIVLVVAFIMLNNFARGNSLATLGSDFVFIAFLAVIAIAELIKDSSLQASKRAAETRAKRKNPDGVR